jgi:hypothetical protein
MEPLVVSEIRRIAAREGITYLEAEARYMRQASPTNPLMTRSEQEMYRTGCTSIEADARVRAQGWGSSTLYGGSGPFGS